MMKRISAYTLFFILLFQLKFAFLPVHTLLVFGALGFMILTAYFRVKITLYFSSMVLYGVFICLSILPALVYNGGDPYYIYEAFLVPFAFYFSAVLVRELTPNKLITDPLGVHKLVLIATTTQSILTLAINLIPSLMSVSNKIIAYSELESQTVFGVLDYHNRFIGFGTEFFGAAVVYSFSLFIIAHLYYNNRKIKYLLLFFFNFIIGFLLARSAIFGGVIALAYIFVKLLPGNILKVLLTMSALLILWYIIKDGLFTYLATLDNDSIVGWATEPIRNFILKGELSSGSTNALHDMWNTRPNNLRTWIIGDGYFRNPSDSGFKGYYMNTDVGYLRIIFASGLLGLIIFLTLHLAILRKVIKRTVFSDSFMYFSVIFFLLLIKGFTTFIPYICILALFQNHSNKKPSSLNC